MKDLIMESSIKRRSAFYTHIVVSVVGTHMIASYYTVYDYTFFTKVLSKNVFATYGLRIKSLKPKNHEMLR